MSSPHRLGSAGEVQTLCEEKPLTIGHVPIRERLILPRRQGVPLQHTFTADTAFPANTDAYLYLYDVEEDELAFWPLNVTGADIVMDITDWWAYRSARSFTVFVEFENGDRLPWYEGAALRMV